MKRILTLCLAASAICASAQTRTLNLEKSGVTYSFPAESTGVMPFSNDGTTVTVGAFSFALDSSSKMWVGTNSVEDNVVTVVYNGSSATVNIAGNIAQYVTAEIDGAYVTLTQNTSVSDATCGEITYRLSGASTDGSFAMTGSYKATVELLGLELTSTRGAALDIQNGKRIELSSKNGTVNTLVDAANGSQKGCIVCTGHLEFKGKGTLNVTGNTAHAIYSKEYVEVKNCTINVNGSVKDGINCQQYFSMSSGTVNISNCGDDGIQIDYKDSENRESEDTGSFTMTGGTLTASTTATAAKAVKAEGALTVTGGELTLSTSGSGEWDTSKLKTKASSCLNSDETVYISGGTINLTSTGGGGKGISCDGELTIDGGEITIKTSGGVFAYVNGKTYDNYTGSTDNLNSDYKSSPKGIKVDSNITINGGTINVNCTGNGAEGIESKAVMTINDGTIVAYTADDCLNSSSDMYLKGGDLTVVATGNDGLDSNGNMYISGGTIRAFGTTSPECGIDVNDEGGYKLYFTGGYILGVGSDNTTPSNSSSTQPYVTCTLSVSAGQTISLKSGSTTMAEFTVPDTYTGSGSTGGNTGGPGGNMGGGSSSGSSKSLIISCPGMVTNSSYTVSNGTNSTTATAKLYGSSSTGGRP